MFTKYLQASDLIEQQIGFDSAQKHPKFGRLTMLTYALIEQLNFETVCSQFLQFQLYDIFMDLEMLCS